MRKDRFYQQIIDALARTVDPLEFQLFAAEMVSSDIPGVVPISGGHDFGMDGAVPDWSNLPFPLICTTSENVIGNLTKSLESYRKGGGTGQKAVVATSRPLSATRRRNLERRAQEFGVTLVQIYERDRVAGRLYRDSKWSLELLGLSGEPSALAKDSPGKRQDFGDALVGRESDLTWLTDRNEHCIVVGQPGLGKTHLLSHLANLEKGAFFLADSDKGRIAAAIRDTAPSTIIVDDAHVDFGAIDTLLSLRSQTGHDYRIVAASWPRAVEELKLKLMVGDKSVRRLSLLSRDEIVEVVRASSITGPREVIREIVNQSEGKPGLAALLSFLCLQGDMEKFWSGRLLGDWVSTSLSKLIGDHPKEILATLSLGGDRGLGLETAAKFLGTTSSAIQSIIAKLAAAGIVSEVGNNISVRPPELRYALVRDTFFCGALSLDPTPIFSAVSRPEDLATTLLMSALRGASISHDLLLSETRRADSPGVWELFAHLGPRESELILESFPENALSIVTPALRHSPAKIIPLLFKTSANDSRPLPQNPDHPLRKVSDWITHARPGTPEVLERRTQLLKSIQMWLSSGGDVGVANRALPLVMHLGFERTEADPGSGMSIELTRGLVSVDEIRGMHRLWDVIQSDFRNAKSFSWEAILKTIEEVILLGRYPGTISSEMTGETRTLARKMIEDVQAACGNHPGALKKIRHFLRTIGEQTPDLTPSEFDIFCPDEDWVFNNLDEQNARLHALAEVWSQLDPIDAASRLKGHEADARLAGIQWLGQVIGFVHRLAETVRSPLEWCNALVSASLNTDYIAPFIARAFEIKEPGWQEFAERELDGPLRSRVAKLCLGSQDVSESLLTRSLEACDELATDFQYFAGLTSDRAILKLLQHANAEVRGYAAVGEWLAKTGRLENPEIRNAWQEAIVGFDGQTYWMRNILAQDSKLAFQWCENRLKRRRLGFEAMELFKSVCQVLSTEQRSELILLLSKDKSADWIRHLVREDISLAKQVLTIRDSKHLHLALAEYKASADWESMLILLLDVGYSPREIASHARPSLRGWSGKESAALKSELQRYQRLGQNADPRIVAIWKVLDDSFRIELARAEEYETHESVFGR